MSKRGGGGSGAGKVIVPRCTNSSLFFCISSFSFLLPLCLWLAASLACWLACRLRGSRLCRWTDAMRCWPWGPIASASRACWLAFTFRGSMFSCSFLAR